MLHIVFVEFNSDILLLCDDREFCEMQRDEKNGEIHDGIHHDHDEKNDGDKKP
jgi:hypothetical protein